MVSRAGAHGMPSPRGCSDCTPNFVRMAGVPPQGLRMPNARPVTVAKPSRASEPQRTSPLRAVARRLPDRLPVSFAGYVAADALHIPGDTTTPPAPAAIPIGPVDV